MLPRPVSLTGEADFFSTVDWSWLAVLKLLLLSRSSGICVRGKNYFCSMAYFYAMSGCLLTSDLITLRGLFGSLMGRGLYMAIESNESRM